MKISKDKSRYFNGYVSLRSSNTSPGESIDIKENVKSHPLKEQTRSKLTKMQDWLEI